MFTRFQSFFITFYNLTAITSIRLDNGCFKISKITFVKNFLFLPIQFVLSKSIPKSFLEVSRVKASGNLVAHSDFFQFIFYLLMILYRIAVVNSVYVQLFRRNKLLAFLNNCRQLIKDFNLEEECEKFERNYLKALAGSYAVLFACYSVEFVAIFHLNWQGVLDSILFHFHGFIIFTCFGFMGFCLHFIHFLFVNVADNLRKNLRNNIILNDKRNYQQMKCVMQAVKSFNETYTNFVSTMIFLATTTVTFKARLNI